MFPLGDLHIDICDEILFLSAYHGWYIILKYDLLAVNQVNAQSKPSEMWRALNVQKRPLKINIPLQDPNARPSRTILSGHFPVPGLNKLTKSTFISDGVKAWPNRNKNLQIPSVREKSNTKICKDIANLTKKPNSEENKLNRPHVGNTSIYSN